jgi:hypothetical protein
VLTANLSVSFREPSMKAVLAVLLAALALPVGATELTPNQMMDWSGAEGDEQVFTANDLTLTLRLGGDDAERTGTLTIETPGTPAVELSGLGSGQGYGQVGVVDFDSSGEPSVIFAVYAGGAHCCMQTTAATRTAGGWVTDDVGSFDGDNVNAEDLDGDGTFEIVMRDDRFNYAFDAYALSYAPPLVLKSADGQVYDASAEPQFASAFQAMFDDAKANCSGETWDLGVCAGMLAAAARLGTYEAESAPVFAAIADGKKTSGWDEFTVCIDAACSSTQELADFREALETALKSWGYLPA